ncbi:MAG: transglycosylase SLT domain-containing protein [Myxococcales bacterium]|nr:transglycosylase SLT domain-containing protein [Myxococcales bacterium]
MGLVGPTWAARRGSPGAKGPVDTARRAVVSYRSGDYAGARKLLLPLADRGALTSLRSRDYLLYLLAESELLLGEETSDRRVWQSAQRHLRELEKLSTSPLLSLARVRLADCLYRLSPDGKSDAEVGTLYRAALASGRSEIDAAMLRFRLGEIAERAGKKNDAREHWRKLYIEHPLHPFAATAQERLRKLDATVKLEVGERIARAKNLLNGHRWFDAVAELRAIPADAGPALRDEIEYWLGTSIYRTRRDYPGAAEKLLGVATRMKGERQAEAMFHGARALSRADKDDEAIAGYRALVRSHPRSHWAPEASFLAGWVEWNRTRYREAITSLLDTVRSYTGPFAEEARWYMGFSRYLLNDNADALGDFEHLTKRPGLLGQKGSYWAGMTELRLGQKAAAIVRFRRLVESHPFTYYSQLARLRLREQGVPLGPFGDTPQSESADGLTAWPDKPDAELLRDARLQRVTELLQLELRWEAAQELRRVESALVHEFTAARAVPTLIGLYTSGEQFQRPHLLAEVHGVSALRRDPHRVPQARPYWEAKYPLAYRALIERFAPSAGNPPRYLYSIMQKESAYNPQDISTADAIGLLQMIPPTSRRVAAHIGRPYTDDILYDPEGNIQFGAWYIGNLLKKFKAQIPLGAGSFNAGPRAMMRWLDKNGDRPLDVFIELCPYRETREYMKKLLDIYAHYVWLWDRQDYLPSLQIDRKYLTPAEDGIDY